MMKFTFTMQEGCYRNYLEIAECLMRYGGLTWSESEKAVNEQFGGLRASPNDDPELDFHDNPYHHAMFILHQDRARAEGYIWWKDPKWERTPLLLRRRWFGEPHLPPPTSRPPELTEDSVAFSFSVEGPGKDFFLLIVEYVVRYGDKSIPEAVETLNEYVMRREALGETPEWTRETPYFWAMGIVHEERMATEGYDWTKDPKFYPPPPPR
jgi:hypothetical protein